MVCPDGRLQKASSRCKSCSPGSEGKRNAEKLRRKVEASQADDRHPTTNKSETTWEAFRKEYEERVLAGLAVRTRDSVKTSLDAFQRHIKPARVFYIGTLRIIDDFVSKRHAAILESQTGRRTVSPHTIPTTCATSRRRSPWPRSGDTCRRLPKCRMEKGPKKLPTYVTGDHFADIYAGLRRGPASPSGLPLPALRFLAGGAVVMGYMTGWRIGDMIGLGTY